MSEVAVRLWALQTIIRRDPQLIRLYRPQYGDDNAGGYSFAGSSAVGAETGRLVPIGKPRTIISLQGGEVQAQAILFLEPTADVAEGDFFTDRQGNEWEVVALQRWSWKIEAYLTRRSSRV